jgi:hypothetical protein
LDAFLAEGGWVRSTMMMTMRKTTMATTMRETITNDNNKDDNVTAMGMISQLQQMASPLTPRKIASFK